MKMPMHSDEDEGSAMESMLDAAAAEEGPGKPSERPAPEAVLAEFKGMVAKMQDLLAQF